jgi:hypothetical protein
MRQSDKLRLKQLVESSVDKFDRSEAYEALAFAERDEADPKAQALLHEAVLALTRGELERTQQILDAIEARP